MFRVTVKWSDGTCRRYEGTTRTDAWADFASAVIESKHSVQIESVTEEKKYDYHLEAYLTVVEYAFTLDEAVAQAREILENIGSDVSIRNQGSGVGI